MVAEKIEPLDVRVISACVDAWDNDHVGIRISPLDRLIMLMGAMTKTKPCGSSNKLTNISRTYICLSLMGRHTV